jgi:hypothetical protein
MHFLHYRMAVSNVVTPYELGGIATGNPHLSRGIRGQQPDNSLHVIASAFPQK